MKVIKKAIILEREEPKTANVFRNLHVYTKHPYINSFSDEGTEIEVLGDFEHVIDELISDLKNVENGREASTWFCVDDEFTKEELLLAKSEMEQMRKEGLEFIEVIF